MVRKADRHLKLVNHEYLMANPPELPAAPPVKKARERRWLGAPKPRPDCKIVVRPKLAINLLRILDLYNCDELEVRTIAGGRGLLIRELVPRGTWSPHKKPKKP
jgi:hypothetical protein